MVQVAQAHSCEDLRKSALKFTCQNLSQVSYSQAFLDMEVSEVCEHTTLSSHHSAKLVPHMMFSQINYKSGLLFHCYSGLILNNTKTGLGVQAL